MIRDYLLLRYLEERSFTDMFMDGHIRLNSLDFFWGEHDEPTKTGQIDSLEGLVCPIDARSTDDCSRNDGYRYCNLLCCNRLNYIQTKDTVGWYVNDGMDDFGDYVVIIKNPDEFQRRLINAASQLEYRCLCQGVDYSDTIDSSRDVFHKSSDFAYQNEWRAALYRGIPTSEPCELYVGPISDIAEWCYTRELQRHLARIFYDRDFVNTWKASYGNVSRMELARLFSEIA